MAIILGVMAPLVIGLPIATMALQRNEGLPLENSDPPLVRLADIEKDPSLERSAGSWLTNGVDWSNRVSYSWSPYATVMAVVREHGAIPGRMWAEGSGVYSPSITCSIYRLRFSRLADGVLDDWLQFYERGWEHVSFVEVSDGQGFDRLYVNEEQFGVDVLARIGNTVIRLHYSGEEDAQTVIDAIFYKIAE
jgi:hypothetical protein